MMNLNCISKISQQKSRCDSYIKKVFRNNIEKSTVVVVVVSSNASVDVTLIEQLKH